MATIGIVALVIIYGGIALELGAYVGALYNSFVQLIYFVVAGLIWVIPAGLLVSWGWKPR